MKAKKEEKYYALVIKAKDWKEFFKKHPECNDELQDVDVKYGKFRESKGKKKYPKYIICNQDEPYAEKVWQTILGGENAKLEPQKSEFKTGKNPKWN